MKLNDSIGGSKIPKRGLMIVIDFDLIERCPATRYSCGRRRKHREGGPPQPNYIINSLIITKKLAAGPLDYYYTIRIPFNNPIVLFCFLQISFTSAAIRLKLKMLTNIL